MMKVCPNCAEENPDRFRMCGFCGSQLTPAAAAEEKRKTVTVVFSDLKGSTSLGERLDSESLRAVLGAYFDAMRTVLDRHGATVEKFIGDAIMAVFGLVRTHEDDALRAVRAAHEMRAALVEVNERLQRNWGVTLENRTGVNTGEVVAGDHSTGQRLVTGDIVNVAARLEQAAPPTEVLIGESTYRLVRHAVEVEEVEPLELKGKSELVAAYRLLDVLAGEAIIRRVDTPIVGRDKELHTLDEAFEQAVKNRECRVVTIVAHAGLGKSRLVTEVSRRLGDRATFLHGRCLSYGEGITFWPLAEIVRESAGIGSADSEEAARAKLTAVVGEGGSDAADRLAAVMSLSDEVYSLPETMWATHAWFDVLARRRPLVVVFDDLHWAEPTLLDLIEHVADSARGEPLLLVCAGRHELLEERPEWMRERERATRLVLSELTPADGALVVRNLLGNVSLPAALESRIIAAASGNPLFVEQMISMLVDDGILVERPEGGWDLPDPSAQVAVPGSISSLLSARLDRLADEERSVIGRAAVIGQVFYASAIRQMGEDEEAASIASALQSLGRKQFVSSADSDFTDELAHQFSHNFVRDAAYQALLKGTRARFHERFANWLDGASGNRRNEYEDIIGLHLAAAFDFRSELGQVDEATRAIGERAAQSLASAAERALGRGDLPAGITMLTRTMRMLDGTDERRGRLLLMLGDAQAEAGELTKARGSFDEAAAFGRQLADRAIEASARLARTYLDYSTDAQSERAEVVGETELAIAEFEPSGEHALLVRAWRILLMVHFTADRFGPAEEAAARVVFHAERAGRPDLARRVLSALATCALLGPTPVPAAITVCEDVLAKIEGERGASALARGVLARLEAMRGNFDRARSLYRQSRDMLEEFGWTRLVALSSLDSAPVEMLAGSPENAARELRRDFDLLTRMGERNYVFTIASFLADTLYHLGDYEQAEQLTRTARENAAEDDIATQVVLRGVRAKLAAREGRLERADELMREAELLAAATDNVEMQGNLLVDKAEVLRLAGDDARRDEALRMAASRFESKGNLVALTRTGSLLDAAVGG